MALVGPVEVKLVRVPWNGPLTMEKVRLSPSTSLPVRVIVVVASVGTLLTVCGSATGSSFTGFTVIVTVAVEHSAGSGEPSSQTS